MRRKLLIAFAAVALVVTAGCTFPGGGPTGTVDLYVTDQPNDDIDQFETLNLTVEVVAFHEAENGEWTARTTSTTVDLTQLDGDKAALVDSLQVPTGEYDKVVMHASVVEAELVDGSTPDVTLATNQLELEEGFEIEEDEPTDFLYALQVNQVADTHNYVISADSSGSGTDEPIDPVVVEAIEDRH